MNPPEAGFPLRSVAGSSTVAVRRRGSVVVPLRREPRTGPVLVSISSPHPLIERGLASMLRAEHRTVLVDRDQAEVVVHDVVWLVERGDRVFEKVVASSHAPVLALTSHLRPELAGRAIAAGARGLLPRDSDAERLAELLEQARRGRFLLQPPVRDSTDVSSAVELARLSRREVQVLRLITLGLSNEEIAAQHFLSINSVKSYIRSAYRKMGVTSRTQAAVWCVTHGFPTAEPTPELQPGDPTQGRPLRWT